MTKPFRWSLAKREQLGSWPDTQDSSLNEAFLTELREASARVLSFSGDARLAFIGRTPENLFDYLSGAFAEVSNAPKVHLVQYSLRWAGTGGVEALPQHKFDALFDYFRDEGIAPETIASSRQRTALVDFVAYGGTMQTFVGLLKRQAAQDGTDWNSVQRKLMIVGLTTRGKNSPNHWRWQQHQDWLRDIPDAVIKNVSVPWGFIIPLANDAPKVTHSFHPGRWGEETGQRRYTPTEDQLKGLSIALKLFNLGNSKPERRTLAREIADTDGMKEASVRKLVLNLKR
ncbi:MAG: hypothetical protein AAFZ91_04455 [Pseudomonadota bacterium]